MKKMKFEVQEKTPSTYGIWNNDMVAWQFIYEWKSNETTDLDKALTVCEQLNIGINP
jgi:hypothetical protein